MLSWARFVGGAHLFLGAILFLATLGILLLWVGSTGIDPKVPMPPPPPPFPTGTLGLLMGLTLGLLATGTILLLLVRILGTLIALQTERRTAAGAQNPEVQSPRPPRPDAV